MGTRFKPRPAGCEPTPRQVRKVALLVCWSCQSRIPQTEGLKPDIYFLTTLEAASLIKVSATLFFFETFLCGLHMAADCPVVFVHASGVSLHVQISFPLPFKKKLCIYLVCAESLLLCAGFSLVAVSKGSSLAVMCGLLLL